MRAVLIVALLAAFAVAGWCQAPGAPPAAPAPGAQPPGGAGMPAGPMGMPGPGMQPGMGMPGGMGMGMGMMGMPMMQPAPAAPLMMIVDGVVYIAYDGTVTAFEAKTLNKLGEGTYGPPARNRNRGGQGGRNGGGGGAPGGPGPAGGPVGPPPAPGG